MNPDYSRFAKSQLHAIGYALSDYALIYPLLLIACGLIGIIFQSSDIMIHLVPPAVAWVIFLMMMFATWAANDCNLYSSSLSLAAALPKWQRSHLAILAGFIGIALAEFHVAGHMLSFLTMLGILIAPISSVFVINSFGRTKAVTDGELDAIPDWQIGQMLAWFLGVLLGFLATSKEAFGLGLISLTSLPTLDSVLGAGVAMLIVKLVYQYKFSRFYRSSNYS